MTDLLPLLRFLSHLDNETTLILTFPPRFLRSFLAILLNDLEGNNTTSERRNTNVSLRIFKSRRDIDERKTPIRCLSRFLPSFIVFSLASALGEEKRRKEKTHHYPFSALPPRRDSGNGSLSYVA